MKHFSIIALFLTIFLFRSNAQVGGLSASKLNTLSATCVNAHKIEFEPSFSISKSTGIYTNIADVVRIDTNFENSFNFRFTYGIFDNWEAGFSVPVDLSTLQAGTKYHFYHSQKILLSSVAGLDFDFSSKSALYGGDAGIIATIIHKENISTDIEIDWHHNFYNDVRDLIFVNTDFGIYIGKVQYIAGLNYQSAMFFGLPVQQLYFTPGVTIEPADNFLMVLSYPFTIYGKNTLQNHYFSFALTITID